MVEVGTIILAGFSLLVVGIGFANLHRERDVIRKAQTSVDSHLSKLLDRVMEKEQAAESGPQAWLPLVPGVLQALNSGNLDPHLVEQLKEAAPQILGGKG